MSTVTASRPSAASAPPAGATAAAPIGGAGHPGRTRVTAKALNHVIAAVAADALGVEARAVSIDLADSSGQLAVTVRSPLRVASLQRVVDDSTLVARTGGTLLERAQAAQQRIRERATELTGSSISTVTVRLTGVDIQTERRAS